MPNVTAKLNNDSPALLHVTTPKGHTAQIGVRITASRWDDPQRNQGRVRYWLEIPGRLSRTEAYEEAFSAADRQRHPQLDQLFPEAVCSVGDHKARVMLSAEQKSTLETQAERILSGMEAGLILRRWQAERDAATQAAQAAHQARVKAEGQPLLIWDGQYGVRKAEFTLSHGYVLTDQECRTRGYREKAVVLGGTQTIALTALKKGEADDIWASGTYLGWYGSEGSCKVITPVQWTELQRRNQRNADAVRRQKEVLDAATQAKRDAIFARAKETGEAQLLDSWMGDDDTIPDNSYSHFALMAQPDGTTKTLKTPTY